METDYWRIVRKVVMVGHNRMGSYYYAKLICLRYRVGSQYPERIDIFKVPVDFGFIPFDMPVRLYFSNDDSYKVVHVEICNDLDLIDIEGNEITAI